jgi:hypothetical protein
MIAGGQRKDLIEVLTFDPELVFAGRVTNVFAAFEHGDHYDFDRDGLGGRSGLGREQSGENSENAQHTNETFEKPSHEFPQPLDLPDMLCIARMRIYNTACGRKKAIPARD